MKTKDNIYGCRRLLWYYIREDAMFTHNTDNVELLRFGDHVLLCQIVWLLYPKKADRIRACNRYFYTNGTNMKIRKERDGLTHRSIKPC